MDKTEKIRELADIASYLTIQLRVVATEVRMPVEKIIVDETDPLGYAILYLEPSVVICKCNHKMTEVDKEKEFQRWICPNCGLQLFVSGRIR